jgi:hypothetical protein
MSANIDGHCRTWSRVTPRRTDAAEQARQPTAAPLLARGRVTHRRPPCRKSSGSDGPGVVRPGSSPGSGPEPHVEPGASRLGDRCGEVEQAAVGPEQQGRQMRGEFIAEAGQLRIYGEPIVLGRYGIETRGGLTAAHPRLPDGAARPRPPPAASSATSQLDLGARTRSSPASARSSARRCRASPAVAPTTRRGRTSFQTSQDWRRLASPRSTAVLARRTREQEIHFRLRPPRSGTGHGRWVSVAAV